MNDLGKGLLINLKKCLLFHIRLQHTVESSNIQFHTMQMVKQNHTQVLILK